MKFVIARPLKDSEPDNLCIYTYGSEIQEGSLQRAKNLLAYVNRQDPKEQYSIYEVSFTKVY
jgi:hypothetical protein